MPTCIEKSDKKKIKKTSKKVKKSKIESSKPKKLAKEIVISVLHPSPERNGDVIEIKILQHEELRLFGSDLLKEMQYTVAQSIYLQPILLFEITGDLKPRAVDDERTIHFILSPSGNTFISTSSLKNNSIYKLELYDVRTEDLSQLTNDDIVEIRDLFMKIDVKGKEYIEDKQIIDYCWNEEIKHLEEWKSLCGMENWNAVEEERKIKVRIKVMLNAFKSAHVNLGKNLSWKEFLLYEARKRRALRYL